MSHMRLHQFRSIFIGFFALLAFIHLAGCNTVEGAGQDIQKTGQSLENAADDNK